jgi:small neutral amino acid transporter SnatA (MarC family)
VRAVNGAVSELASNTLLVVGALFPIVNPLGNAPIFLTLTRGHAAGFYR